MELNSFLSERDFPSALQFGIKLWNSIEYVQITKYETIIEYLCANLPKYTKHIKKNGLNFDEEFAVVNKVLASSYPMIAVSGTVQQKLVDCLIVELQKSLKSPKDSLIESLFIIVLHQNMKNYFKDNLASYGQVLEIFFSYYKEHLKVHVDQVAVAKSRVEAVFHSINNYIKVIDMFPGFKAIFYSSIMSTVCEFVVYAKSIGIDFYAAYLTMLKTIFFKHDNQKLYTEFFQTGTVKEQPDWLNLFDVKQQPIHVVLVTIESFLMAYSSANQHCVEFLFKNVFDLSNGENVREKLICINHFVGLLIKYDVKLTDVNSFAALITDIVGQHHVHCLAEVLDVCMSVIHFNKYLLEGKIFALITDFMFLKKNEREFEKYAKFMRTVLNVMYETESARQFVDELSKSVKLRLLEVKLSKKLKRKSKKFDNEEATLKKRKTEDGVSAAETNSDGTEIDDQLKLVLLPSDVEQSSDYSLNENPWTDISYAWPHADIGQSFMLLCDKFRPTTVGHPIVNHFVDNLLEELNELSASDVVTENQLFLIDFYSCLLSEFLIGSRIAEKAVKKSSQIANISEQMQRLLSTFGNKLLNMEHNTRLMNSFLNVCYNNGNFEILLLYYLPDTYTTKKATDADAEAGARPNLDVSMKLASLYSYLSTDEWSSLEQRIINFGKDECKNIMNRLYLQKLRANLLLSANGNQLTSSLMLASLNEFSQMQPILEDSCTNLWFINQLNRQQMITVADLMLESGAVNTVHKLLENREFFELMLVSVYKAAAGHFQGKSSVLKTIDFVRAHDFDGEMVKVLKTNINEKVQQSAAIKKYSRDEIARYVDLLESLPLEYLEDGVKSFAFGLNLALFVDCAATKDEELTVKAYQVFLKLLYNKLPQDLSKAYNLDMLLMVLPDLEKYQQLYDFYIFNACKCFNAQTQKNFEKILKSFEGDAVASEQFLLLGLCIVQKMGQMTTAQLKQDEVASLLKRFVLQCTASAVKMLKKISDNEKHAFLQKTFSGFLSILRYSLTKKDDADLLGKVKVMLQHYIDFSIHSATPASKVLLNIFIKSSEQIKLLDIEKDTIDEYFNAEWARFEQEAIDSVNNGLDAPVKYTDIDVTHLIVLNKTEVELKQLLKTVVAKFNKKNIEDNNFLILLKIFERLINLAGRLDISPEKISIIMSHCQNVIQDHLSALYVGKSDENLSILIRILHCYSNSTKRQRIVVYQGNVDTILDVLLHINIKKVAVTNENRAQFFDLHDLMSEIIFNLVKKREKVIMNRIPQLLEVYKDLCRIICSYKAEQKQLQLDNDETIQLAQLSHKLEKLTEHIISMGDIVKLVAPATLTHLIKIMITNKKSAALPEKIKKIFRNICYLWIKICNDSASNLITRMCRDDVKNIYTKLCKEYEMFVKFKGKI